MNNKKRIVSTIAIASVAFGAFIPLASAEPVDDGNNSTSNNEQKVLNDANELSSLLEKDMPYSSKITLIESNESKTIVLDSPETVNEVLTNNGFNVENFKDSKGEPANSLTTPAKNETLTLYRSEVSATMEDVEIPAPVIEEKTDELFVGETKVKTEGKAGKALKTIVDTNDLSVDKEINKEADGSKQSKTVEENLTITEAPEAKIVLVGTKEPVIEPEPVLADAEEIAETNENPVGEVVLSNNEEKTENSSSSKNTSTNTSTNNSTNVSAIKNSNNPQGQKAVDLALSRVGSPYVWAASGPNAFDCSGLIVWTYNTNLGKNLPRTADQIGAASTPIAISELQPGDILWSPSHIALYIGDGKIVHASGSKDEVTVASAQWAINDGYKAGRIK